VYEINFRDQLFFEFVAQPFKVVDSELLPPPLPKRHNFPAYALQRYHSFAEKLFLQDVGNILVIPEFFFDLALSALHTSEFFTTA